MDKISQTGAEYHVDCSDMAKHRSKPEVIFQYGGRLGKFSGMSCQSQLSHCRVLPPGEFSVMILELCVTCRVLPFGKFTVMIPKPHATLQGAATWQIQ